MPCVYVESRRYCQACFAQFSEIKQGGEHESEVFKRRRTARKKAALKLEEYAEDLQSYIDLTTGGSTLNQSEVE